MEAKAWEQQGLTAEEANELWQRLFGEKDLSARQTLISHHLPLARAIAGSLFAGRHGSDVEFGDYLQYAIVGLIEAIDRYDPTQNASFATYAAHRVRGAVLSGIERLTERREQGALRKRLRSERAQAISTGVDRRGGDLFYEMVDVAIGLALGYMLDDSGLYCDENASTGDEPYHSVELKALRENVRTIVAALPDKERAIIQYHYYHYMSFTDIADILRISKGRVSQLHVHGLALLRQAYENWHKLDVAY
jgi:RNA polymerase sigma factor for flagellar operon FliA